MRQELIWRGMQVIKNMERETGLEPATSSLGSWHSTTELLPLKSDRLLATWPLFYAANGLAINRHAQQTDRRRFERTDRERPADLPRSQPREWPGPGDRRNRRGCHPSEIGRAS